MASAHRNPGRLLKMQQEDARIERKSILGDTSMKINQCGSERVIRAMAGAVLVLISLFFHAIPEIPSLIMGVAGAILIVTGIAAYCPAWHLLGVSTAKKPISK